LLTLLLLLVCSAATQASEQPASPASEPSVSTAAQSPAIDETAPVAVPPPSEKALDYYRTGNWLWAADQVWSFATLLVILGTGFSARLRDWSRRVGRNWFFTVAVYWALFTVLGALLDLPLGYYRDFLRPHAYGLSNQTLQKFITDTLTEVALTAVIGALVIWVLYLLLKKSPTRWWLYSAVALLPFIIVANLVAPIWISPLFNTFEPMKDKTLEARILAEASRAGIEGSRVFEVNKSVDTNTPNAYVAGLLGTKRIVVWDTTIKRMNEPELLFVVGHEMGHYVLNHIWQMLALSMVSIVVSFWAAYRMAGAVIRRFGARMGFDALSDIASLPLLFVLLAVVGFATTPFTNAFTRHAEHEADRFGLEITQANHSAANAFVKLQTDALAIPRPGLLYELWHGSHPSLGDRIDFANAYHPWRSAEPLKYGHLFKR
jgi:Zn-dependent protease with chaperone function